MNFHAVILSEAERFAKQIVRRSRRTPTHPVLSDRVREFWPQVSQRAPEVKRGLVHRQKKKQWEWSSFRSYLFGETGLVRLKFKESPIEIKSRSVATFGEGNNASLIIPSNPLIRKERERVGQPPATASL
jgi:hypothetical protein